MNKNSKQKIAVSKNKISNNKPLVKKINNKNNKKVAVKSTSKSTIPTNKSPKRIVKKKKPVKAILIVSIIFVLLAGISVSYLVWNYNREFTVSLTDISGIEYSGYDNTTIKNGNNFCFTIDIDEGLVEYPELLAVKANGVTLEADNGIYTVAICADTKIEVFGYGTPGLFIDNTTIIAGVNNELIIIPYGITNIGYNSFDGLNLITTVVIPDTVTKIEDVAFYNCTNLTDITFSNNLYTVGFSVLYGTKWLNNQPNGIVYINDNIVYSYKGTMPANSNIFFREGIISICGMAFMQQEQLFGIHLPESLKYIGEGAFIGCINLQTIDVKNSIQYIGRNVFYATLWLNNHADGLVYLNNWLYSYKGTLSTVSLTIQDGVIGIAGNAFNSLTGLTSVEIPASVKYICTYAFYNCNISTISLPENLEYIGESAFYKTSLTTITIPSKVKTIELQAFGRCTNLVSVNIISNIDILPHEIFTECSNLESITFTGDVNKINSNAFYNCTKLNSITINSSTPPTIIGSNFLSNTSANLHIYVPTQSLATYKSYSGWSAFSDKIFAIS